MSQQFQVLRCFKCKTFQVHQVKKSIKWECKMCGDKQSVKRNYGTGSGKDCRLHVQTLNALRGEAEDIVSGLHSQENCSPIGENKGQENKVTERTERSKWSAYLEKDVANIIQNDKDDNNYSLDGVEVVLEMPKRKRKHNKYYLNKLNESCQPVCKKQECLPTTHDAKSPIVDDCTEFSSAPKLIADLETFTENNSTVKINSNTLEMKPASDAHKVLYKPPPLSKSSKWAQYLENDAELQIDEENNTTRNVYNYTNAECAQPVRSAGNAKFTLENESIAIHSDGNNLRSSQNMSIVKIVESSRGISFSQCGDDDIDEFLNL